MRQSPHCVRKGIAFAHPGILSRGNDGCGIALHDSCVDGLRVISPIACHSQQLMGGNLCEQLRQYGSISDMVVGDADGPHLQV
jgi:hypothetical protein